jgi:hypothetical protein
LVWGLGLFAALQLGLAVAIETGWPQFRDPYYGYRVAHLRNRLGAAGRRPRAVVFVGSSHVQDGVEAPRLERALAHASDRPVAVFNFGIPGGGPVTNLLTVRRLLVDNLRPDLLVIEVSPMFLTSSDDAPGEAGYYPADRLWRDDLAVVASYGFPVVRLRREWWEGWPVPWYMHRTAILSRVAPGFLPLPLRLDRAWRIDERGWHLSPMAKSQRTPQQQREAREVVRRELGQTFGRFRLVEASCRATRDLLALCRREGIATALLWMPEGPTCRTWFAPGAIGQIEGFFDDLSRRSGAPLIDARDWVADEDFADHHHLLDTGARAFSDRLGREVLRPMVYALSGNPPAGPVARND